MTFICVTSPDDSNVYHTIHVDIAYMDTSRRNAIRHGIPSHDCTNSPQTMVPTNIPPPTSDPKLIVHLPPFRCCCCCCNTLLLPSSFHNNIAFTVEPKSGLPFPNDNNVAPAKRGGNPNSNEKDSNAGEKYESAVVANKRNSMSR